MTSQLGTGKQIFFTVFAQLICNFLMLPCKIKEVSKASSCFCKILTNFEDCTESRIRSSVPAFFLLCHFSLSSSVHVIVGFQNYFQHHRRLSERFYSHVRLSENRESLLRGVSFCKGFKRSKQKLSFLFSPQKGSQKL